MGVRTKMEIDVTTTTAPPPVRSTTLGEPPVRSMTFGEAYQSLLSSQKSNRGAPAYSRWVNRPLGRVLAAGAYRLGWTPNQVTALSAAFTYSAIALIALVPPSIGQALLVALLLVVGYALDSADGQLARLTKSGRPSGEWLDHAIDMGKICLLHAAVAISWVRFGVPGAESSDWLIAIPLLFGAVAVVTFFSWLLSDLLVRIARARSQVPAPLASPADEPAPALRSLLRLPGDYGLLAVLFTLFATPAFMPAYTLLLLANAVILAAALPVYFQQVRRSEELS